MRSIPDRRAILLAAAAGMLVAACERRPAPKRPEAPPAQPSPAPPPAPAPEPPAPDPLPEPEPAPPVTPPPEPAPQEHRPAPSEPVPTPRPRPPQASNYPRAIANVFASEGGYTNHRSDPGGPTNFGITIHDARRYGAEFGWIARPTAADMRAMPKWFAERVYRSKYADPIRFDDLPFGLDYCVLDYAVNSGTGRAPKVLQRCLRLLPVTGRVDDATVRAANRANAARLINAVCDERLRFVRSLHTWPVFGPGWGRRIASVRAIALRMANPASSLFDVPDKPERSIGKAYDARYDEVP